MLSSLEIFLPPAQREKHRNTRASNLEIIRLIINAHDFIRNSNNKIKMLRNISGKLEFLNSKKHIL